MEIKPRQSTRIAPGHAFELAVFGTRSNLTEDTRTYRFAEFTLCREQAMRIARTKGWKPDNPREHLLIAKLFQQVKKIMDTKYLPYIIEVWPSIGTRLDYIHGVDGMFTAALPNKDSEKVFFYFDLTLDRNKKIKQGISVLNPVNFKGALIKTAHHIVSSLQTPLLAKAMEQQKNPHT